jgi:TRAP-type C4-dicarboxylate transport system permease small subunit
LAVFDKVVSSVTRFFDRVAQAGVAAMMLLVVGNILMRIAWKPIFGTYDYVEFIGALMVAFALGYCAVQKGHISVELVIARLPERVQGIVGSITNILSLVIFGLITWQCLLFAHDTWRVGGTSMGALVPNYPYIYGVAFGIALLCLVILVDLGKSLVKAVSG